MNPDKQISVEDKIDIDAMSILAEQFGRQPSQAEYINAKGDIGIIVKILVDEVNKIKELLAKNKII